MPTCSNWWASSSAAPQRRSRWEGWTLKNTFDKVGPKRRQEIALEIALKGQGGLDINDPEPKYALKSMPGKFSGLQLVSIMYAAFKQIDPKMDAGIDLQREYDAALALREPK